MPVLYTYYNRQLITILEKSLNISGISNEIVRGGYKISLDEVSFDLPVQDERNVITKERRQLLMLERQCSLSLTMLLMCTHLRTVTFIALLA